jgi:DNA-directed RNA polymerase III subunit RPC6
MLVVQVITQAGNAGIWTRDMKQRTNLPQTKISKTLKLLEERGVVKAVKSVQHASRKVYMLAVLEPGKELTGGPWYGGDQQPDTEFIETIRKVARGFVEREGRVTLAEVVDFIQESGVTNQVLCNEDVQSIMKTLEYDHIVDEFEDTRESENLYRPAPSTLPQRTRFSDVPCGVCPVFADCHEGGRVSPQTCQYYTQWLGALDF